MLRRVGEERWGGEAKGPKLTMEAHRVHLAGESRGELHQGGDDLRSADVLRLALEGIA